MTTLRKKKKVLFPKAKFVVSEEALNRAQSPHLRDRASFIPELQELLHKTRRLLVVKNGQTPSDLPRNIFFRLTYGHTPGQLHTGVQSGEAVCFFASDLIPGRKWVHLPITMGYDRYPEKLIDEKKALYDRAVEEKWHIFYTHDHEISSSQIMKNEKGRYVPFNEQKTLVKWKLSV